MLLGSHVIALLHLNSLQQNTQKTKTGKQGRDDSIKQFTIQPWYGGSVYRTVYAIIHYHFDFCCSRKFTGFSMYAVWAEESLTQVSASTESMWIDKVTQLSLSSCTNSTSNSAILSDDYAMLLSAQCACVQSKENCVAIEAIVLQQIV